MTSLISPASYLSKDTFSRWLNHPTSPLARFLVAFLLAGLATIVLVLFAMAEKVVVARLEKVGLNALVIAAPLQSGEVPAGSTRYSALADWGESLPLVRIYRPGNTGVGMRAAVYSYADEAIPTLAKLGARSPVLVVSKEIPAGVTVPVKIDTTDIDAQSIAAEGVLRLIPHESGAACILVPERMAANWLADGGAETVLFERRSDCALTLPAIMSAIDLMHSQQQLRATSTGPVELLAELDMMKDKQASWKLALAAGFALVLVAVFAALSILEYRQNAYVAALLRSFGVRKRWILSQYLLEAATIVNAAGAAVVATIWVARLAIANGAGYPDAADLLGVTLLSPGILAAVFIALNLGAALATLPVGVMLRKPVGLTL